MNVGAKCRIWVAGLGNVLMRDDGVGAVAARLLSESPPPDTVVSEVGTAIMFYTNEIAEAEQILCIDAVSGGRKPGTVTTFTLDDICEAGDKWGSAHELTLLDAVDIFRNGKRPPIRIIGIEPERIEYGLELSESVQGALPEIIELARTTISEMASGSKLTG